MKGNSIKSKGKEQTGKNYLQLISQNINPLDILKELLEIEEKKTINSNKKKMGKRQA